MTNKTTDELIAERFDELQKSRAAILSSSAPFHKERAANREKQDKLIAEEADIVAKIKESESDLYETDMEISKLVNLLPGTHRRMSEIA